MSDSAVAAARIRELDEAWLLAHGRGDLDGMMAIYTDDAEELLPDLAPIVGRDSIRAFYQALLEAHPRWRHELWPERIQVARAGDLAVVRGTYRASFDPDQPGTAARGKFVASGRSATAIGASPSISRIAAPPRSDERPRSRWPRTSLATV